VAKSVSEVNTRQDMSLVKLIDTFREEDTCRLYLERLRWGDKVRCVRCGSDKISRIGWKGPKGRRQYDCGACRYRFSVTAGTVFHDSHLPLWKWFLATYLMVESKKGMSANQIRRTLGVSYKTAWYLCHRIRSAMVDAVGEQLSGTVEADETWIGGSMRGQHRKMSNKSIVLGALERGGNIRLRALRKSQSVSAVSIKSFLADAVADDAVAIYTDSHPGYKGIGDANTRHETVDHHEEEWVRGEVGTQGIESSWSLLKRSIIGSYHQLSAKHLPAYLDEFSFRFNGRENPYLFRDTLLALCKADALPYRDLVQA
jgi:transposase-like protein